MKWTLDPLSPCSDKRIKMTNNLYPSFAIKLGILLGNNLKALLAEEEGDIWTKMTNNL